MAHVRKKGNLYRILGGKPEGKGLFLSPRSRWKDKIKQKPKETAWEMRIVFMWLRID